MGLELRIASDLHLEFENIYLPELPGDNRRVLVLAGDIGVSRKRYTYIPFLRDAADRFRSVVWVFGNHEHFGDSIYRSRNHVRELLEEDGFVGKIHILENETLVVENTAFLGATLWTDVDSENPLAKLTVENGMNDYAKIRTGSKSDPYKRKLSATETISFNKASKAWLLKESEAWRNAGKNIVVVTHHLPTYKSIPQELQADRLNAAFASSMEEDMAKIGAKVWVHGHTHYSADYILPCGTRVVCNPRGYSGIVENPVFDPKMIVEIVD